VFDIDSELTLLDKTIVQQNRITCKSLQRHARKSVGLGQKQLQKLGHPRSSPTIAQELRASRLIGP